MLLESGLGGSRTFSCQLLASSLPANHHRWTTASIPPPMAHCQQLSTANGPLVLHPEPFVPAHSLRQGLTQAFGCMRQTNSHQPIGWWGEAVPRSNAQHSHMSASPVVPVAATPIATPLALFSSPSGPGDRFAQPWEAGSYCAVIFLFLTPSFYNSGPIPLCMTCQNNSSGTIQLAGSEEGMVKVQRLDVPFWEKESRFERQRILRITFEKL